MRKSVTVTVNGENASFRTEHNGFEKEILRDFPPSSAFESMGFERRENYKVVYSLDPNGSLVFRNEFYAACGIPDVREYNNPHSDYIDTCFLKGLGWPNGARVSRTIFYKNP